MDDRKAISLSELSKDIKQNDSSNHIRLMWPDDYISLGPDDPFVSIQDDESYEGGSRPSQAEDGRAKRMLVRPQVTVNVFSTGGSSLGGSLSAAGGAGSGGTATINDGNGGYGGYGDPTAIHALGSQLAALSEKVERLSLLASASGAVIETGTWCTNDVRPWSEPRHKTEGRVTFAREFQGVPNVTVSMSLLDISNGANSRVKVFVTDIDTKGFTVHADSWSDTQLYSCEVSWFALGK